MVGIGMSDVFCKCCCFTELFKTISFPYFQFDPFSNEERGGGINRRGCVMAWKIAFLKRKMNYSPPCVFVAFTVFNLIDVLIDQTYTI